MTRTALRLAFVCALAGAGMAAASQPAAAFYGSFWQSCHGVRIYGGGQEMTAYCRTLDGAWRFSHVYYCGGVGVRNSNGFLTCGTD